VGCLLKGKGKEGMGFDGEKKKGGPSSHKNSSIIINSAAKKKERKDSKMSTLGGREERKKNYSSHLQHSRLLSITGAFKRGGVTLVKKGRKTFSEDKNPS